MYSHAVLVLVSAVAVSTAAAQAPRASAPHAVELAGKVMDRLGGEDAWAGTRYVQWRFFGRRMHYWDRSTGDLRIESPAHEARDGEMRPSQLILMNVHTRGGRAWEDGDEVKAPDRLRELLDLGHEWWINDSYWMFMPYKMLDPGVVLRYVGERKLEDSRLGDVVEMTFEPEVGYTPRNKYEVWIGRDSGLVEQWTFWNDATDEQPGFTLPWDGWRQFGDIWLATGHGQGKDWEIDVPRDLPRSVFTSPDPVSD